MDNPPPTAPTAKLSFLHRMFSETNVPLNEFTDLFLMEAMTGFFGCAFTVGWGFEIAVNHANVVSSLWPYAAIVFTIFFILLGTSLLPLINLPFTGDFALQLRQPDNLTNERSDALAMRVRLMIAGLSFMYAVACALLIWMTGGARSPFVPFFVMIYTLTVTYTKVPAWFAIVLLFYLVMVTAACYAASHYPPRIAPADWRAVLESEVQTLVHYAFIALSLIVPTISSAAVEYRVRQRKQAEAQ